MTDNVILFPLIKAVKKSEINTLKNGVDEQEYAEYFDHFVDHTDRYMNNYINSSSVEALTIL